MSKGQRIDLRNTMSEPKHPSGKTLLRHRPGSQAKGIDEMCLKGMTESEMVSEIIKKG